MIELLQKLFFGHHHKWNIIRHGNIVDECGDVTGNYYDLQCEICGNVKRKNHSA